MYVHQVGEQGVPSLSEAEEAYTAEPGGSADVSHLQAERQRSRMRLSSIARLEQVAPPSSHYLIIVLSSIFHGSGNGAFPPQASLHMRI